MELVIILGLAVYVIVQFSSSNRRIEKLEKQINSLWVPGNLIRSASSDYKNAAARAEHSSDGVQSQQTSSPEDFAEPLSPSNEQLGEPLVLEQGDIETPEDAAIPPFSSAEPPREARAAAAEPQGEKIDWERFSGVKLASWVGGLALFLGAVFFVKYSIERGLLTPLMRITMGFVSGTGLLVAGVLMKNEKYHVLRQTFAASGVAMLYAVIFAARSYYSFIDTPAAFVLMALTTAAGCLASGWLNSKYVAILALLGGFLTPVLLSTGEDHPVALFSYIALLDIGLLTLARHMGWGLIALLSAAGTVMMTGGWHFKFFTVQKIPVSMWVVSLFGLLYSLMLAKAEQLGKSDKLYRFGVCALLVVSMLFPAFIANAYEEAALCPWTEFAVLFWLNALLSAFVLKCDFADVWHSLGGMLTFFALLGWTTSHLTEDLLPWGLGYFLLFAALHSAIPVTISKFRKPAPAASFSALAPLFVLVLLLLNIATTHTASFLLWPAALAVNLLALLVSAALGTIWIGLVALFLTVLTVFAWLEYMTLGAGADLFLFVVLGFAAVFFAAGIYFMRKNIFASKPGGAPAPGQAANRKTPDLDPAVLSTFAAGLPFLLIAVALLRLKPEAPGLFFGVTLVLAAMLWALVRVYKVEYAAIAATFGAFLPLAVWQMSGLAAHCPSATLCWYGAMFVLLSAPPLMFRRHFMDMTAPWTASAMAGLVLFLPAYYTVKQAGWIDYAGLVPAVFAAGEVIMLLIVYNYAALKEEGQKTRLALYGSAALLFISLIFPIQFNNEWITLGWVLEGCALVWLYRRIPHEKLKPWGFLLLFGAFIRLVLNPAVLAYHPRQETVLVNWFLYTYGISAAAMFTAAALWQPAEERGFGVPIRSALRLFATLVLFLLVNIEIADYFSTGSTITFQFSGNFARDLSYTLAWGVFALGLLFAGIKNDSRPARVGCLSLFAATVLKLFFHDLWQLGLPYRAAAFIGMAACLIAVSYFYQRYLSAAKGANS